MCGIAGIMAPGHRERIVPVTRLMAHRGPDEEGFFHDDRLSLGQRRLSIIDLGGGHQPMANETGRLQLVCNGEIYNSPELRRGLQARGHTFRTSTDVEVILHLYEEKGRDCVKDLRGMFAFAVWDPDRDVLFLARDHMGQKPLFYAQRDGAFAFASEVKSVLASGMLEAEPDLNGLWHYISLRYLPDDYTLFSGLHKLPSASTLWLEGGRVSVERYWSLDFRSKRAGTEAQCVEELDELLRDTVRLHLLSDVPLGSFLSGGIDSSVVTAMMAKAMGEPFPTFSIGVKEQRFNELPYARRVSSRYGLQARERVVEADLIHLVPSMIRHMDEPSDPFGVGVYLVSQVAAEEVKVVLSGDGGDENFAGYDRFAGQRMVDFYAWLPAAFRRTVMKRLLSLVPESYQYKSLAQKLAWANDMSFYGHGERYARSMSFLRFTDEQKRSLFTAPARARIGDADSTAKILAWFESDGVDELVDRMLCTDLMTRMPDHLLAIADRMSMAHSLEVRPPLIDHRVCEFAASLPGRMKLRGRNLKHILKRVASRYLPEELIYREKQGFGFPIGIWLRTDLRRFVDRLFAQSRFIELGLFDRAFVEGMIREHMDGVRDHNYRLWILINLELWYRLYFEGQGVDDLRELTDSLL